MEEHVSVQNHHQAHPIKVQSDTYEENHREEEASGHKHCKKEKPSYFEGNKGRSPDTYEFGAERSQGNEIRTCTTHDESKDV